MSRIQVGERVEIIGGIKKGSSGVLKRDDRGKMPFLVDIDDGFSFWCHEEEVRRVSSAPTEGRPVTAFEVGKWYQWVGPKDYEENWTRSMDAWKDGKPRQCKSTELNNQRGEFDGIGTYYYGHCFEHFREVPAPSQGHTHSVEKLAASASASQDPRIGRMTYPYRVDGITFDVDKFRSFTNARLGEPYSGKSRPESRADIRKRLLNLE